MCCMTGWGVTSVWCDIVPCVCAVSVSNIRPDDHGHCCGDGEETGHSSGPHLSQRVSHFSGPFFD